MTLSRIKRHSKASLTDNQSDPDNILLSGFIKWPNERTGR